MGVIFNEAEAVWEWLMTHLIVINLLFSIIIIFLRYFISGEISYPFFFHVLENF